MLTVLVSVFTKSRNHLCLLCHSSFEGGVHHKISKISIIKKAELDMEIYGNFE